MRFWMWRSAVALFWRQREKSQCGCTTTIPRVHNSPKMFLKVYSLLLPWAELSFAWIGAKIRPCRAKKLIFSLWISSITYSVQPTRLTPNSCRNRSKHSPRRGGSLPKGGNFSTFGAAFSPPCTDWREISQYQSELRAARPCKIFTRIGALVRSAVTPLWLAAAGRKRWILTCE